MNQIIFKNFESKKNWITGQNTNSNSGKTISVVSPYFDKEIATIPESDFDDLEKAVKSAKSAFHSWVNLNIRDRAEVMFRFKTVLEKNLEELSHLIALDNGKTIEDAKGSILRGKEVVEFATSLPNILRGDSSQVANGITCTMTHEPLGVVAGITPFNFPAMVPLWMIPLAITTGNCFILKPSEQTPLAALKLAEYLKESGLPDGVFSVLNGSRKTVEAICDHPDIKAVAFVGSSNIAKIVYARCSDVGKRALCLGGAKNHMIIAPDADVDSTAKGVLASSMGSAGQRCMAASVAVGVSGVDPIIDQLVEEAKKFIIGKDMGTIISRTALDRITGYIDEAEKTGAKILIDGRNVKPPNGYENGYWLGSTILDEVDPEWACARDEIFGPVLSIIRTDSLEDAMKIENKNPYGNAASVFTTSGDVAKTISQSAKSGMVGINIGVPVPREPYSFGGWNESKYGHGDITGKSGVNFWTNLKKVTARWPESDEIWKKYF
ncbi:MAG: methylmalonate-semialdehyde dehydrogenase (CoA acylating) [Candidatus Marinimicrobia bacterium]|nr:methylmalonate-semialdehyde dehydrogenase (CoA acylating) [Candidatus Neomarinimicrobiota bacterium]|tara:strand:+ start:76222 stop:77703 length:1482 start_codon:yes stop_codon:yes gene_type:complete